MQLIVFKLKVGGGGFSTVRSNWWELVDAKAVHDNNNNGGSWSPEACSRLLKVFETGLHLSNHLLTYLLTCLFTKKQFLVAVASHQKLGAGLTKSLQ